MKVIVRSVQTNASTIKLHLIADLHTGSGGCASKETKEHLANIKNDPNSYVMLLGDLLNNSIKSSIGDPYEEILTPKQQKAYVIGLLQPLTDKILAITGGNHEYRTKKETTIDLTEQLAYDLGIHDRYSEDIGILKLIVGNKGRHDPAYTILFTHGNMGGSKLGAGLTRCEDFINGYEGIDAIAVGHSHKPSAGPISRTVFDPYNNVYREKVVYIVVATGWQNHGGYPARKMLKPVPIAPNYFVLNSKTKRMQVVV